jgi:hypothetical protein
LYRFVDIEFFTKVVVTSLHTAMDEFSNFWQSSNFITTSEMTGDTWSMRVGADVGCIDGIVVLVGCGVGLFVCIGIGGDVGKGFSVSIFDGFAEGFWGCWVEVFVGEDVGFVVGGGVGFDVGVLVEFFGCLVGFIVERGLGVSSDAGFFLGGLFGETGLRVSMSTGFGCLLEFAVGTGLGVPVGAGVCLVTFVVGTGPGAPVGTGVCWVKFVVGTGLGVPVGAEVGLLVEFAIGTGLGIPVGAKVWFLAGFFDEKGLLVGAAEEPKIWTGEEVELSVKLLEFVGDVVDEVGVGILVALSNV